MATMAASRLNPDAPEFIPITHHLNYNLRSIIPPFFLPPNPNPSIYYSTSVPSSSPSPSFLQYSNSSFSKNETHLPLVSENSDGPSNPAVTQKTQPVHESAGVVNPRGGKRGGTSGYRKRYCCGYSNNRRERGHFNHQGDGSDYKSNWKRRQDFGDRRNRSSILGGSRSHHPVLPVESDGHNTTVMIRNIPNRYTRELLMELLDEHCRKENEEGKKMNEKSESAYDFLYLPIDFKNKVNKGYAFVNFTEAKGVWRFNGALNNKRWPLFLSNKVCSVAYARLQGKEELVRHFEKSVFDCETDEYLPVSYSPARDGSGGLVEQRLIGRRRARI